MEIAAKIQILCIDQIEKSRESLRNKIFLKEKSWGVTLQIKNTLATVELKILQEYNGFSLCHAISLFMSLCIDL